MPSRFPHPKSIVLPLAVTAALSLTAQPALAKPASTPETPTATAAAAPPKDTDRVIVKFKEPATQEAAKERVVEAAAVDALPASAAPKVKEHVKRTPQDADVVRLDRELSESEQERVIDQLKADPAVEYAEPDRLAAATWVPNDVYEPFQWHLGTDRGVNFPAAWDQSRGNGQTIAVLDTGITSHPDLDPKVVAGRDFVSPLELSVDGDGRDADPRDNGDWSMAGECGSFLPRNSTWHGTHVAGLAAAVTNNGQGVSGAAPGAKIQPVRVLGKCTFGWVSDIADAVTWASGGTVAGQPANPNPSTVINMSLNYPGMCGDTMQAAINGAVRRNVPVVAAAGNSGMDAVNTAPANCDNVIVVGAAGPGGSLTNYSNIGSVVDVLAPGGTAADPLLSTVNSGARDPEAGSYGNQYGTSMASPLVAGTVALMKQKDPRLSPARIEQVLKSTASGNLGSLQVNPAAAVRAVTPAPTLSNPSVDSYTVRGAIGSKWRATGGAAQWGQPVMNEANAAGGGRYQTFRKDNRTTTIYWHPSIGTGVVQNQTGIGSRFDRAGKERGYGYPVTDLRKIKGGYYQIFRQPGGAYTKVLWTSAIGAHPVRESGAIGSAWKRAGFENGWGWPTSAEFNLNGQVHQRFSNGVVAHWTSARGVWTTRS